MLSIAKAARCTFSTTWMDDFRKNLQFDCRGGDSDPSRMSGKHLQDSTDVHYCTNSQGPMIEDQKQMFFSDDVVAGKPMLHHNKKALIAIWQWDWSPSDLLHPPTNPLQVMKLNVGEFTTAVTFLWASATPVCRDVGVQKVRNGHRGVKGWQLDRNVREGGRRKRGALYCNPPSLCWSDVTCWARTDFWLFPPEKIPPCVLIQGWIPLLAAIGMKDFLELLRKQMFLWKSSLKFW